jgi:hypothetical protein
MQRMYSLRFSLMPHQSYYPSACKRDPQNKHAKTAYLSGHALTDFFASLGTLDSIKFNFVSVYNSTKPAR